MQIVGTDETFQFPNGDSLLLDLEYTSIEELAAEFARRIHAHLAEKGPRVMAGLTGLRVSVQEYKGLKCFRCMELGLQGGTPQKL
jgi:hypothetical protein